MRKSSFWRKIHLFMFFVSFVNWLNVVLSVIELLNCIFLSFPSSSIFSSLWLAQVQDVMHTFQVCNMRMKHVQERKREKECVREGKKKMNQTHTLNYEFEIGRFIYVKLNQSRVVRSRMGAFSELCQMKEMDSYIQFVLCRTEFKIKTRKVKNMQWFRNKIWISSDIKLIHP